MPFVPAIRLTDIQKSRYAIRSSAFDYRRLESRQMLAVTAVLDGGTGILTINGDGLANDVTVSLVAAGATLQVDVVGGSQFQFTAIDVNRVDFNGAGGDDVFYNQTDKPVEARGHAGNDTINSGGGDDYIHGGAGQDFIAVTGGTNSLYGGDDNDEIHGGSGNDFVLGGTGDDILLGGAGNDDLRGDWGDDFVDGQDGDDVLSGFSGRDILFGADGQDQLFGQAGNDTLFGELGNDRLRGGPGDDEAYGGPGRDFLLGDQDNDNLNGGDGNDTIIGYDGDDVINGDAGQDWLFGQNGNDQIFGGSENDLMRGGPGNDYMNGLGGRDRVAGDQGDDLLYGGAGNDIVLGDAGNDVLFGESGNDTLRGHDGMDLLRGGTGVDSLFGGNDADSLFGGQKEDADQLTGEAGSDRFLIQAIDVVNDRTAEDAVVVFLDFDDGWTDLEITVLDRGFAQLYQRLNNHRLLADTLPTGDLTFYKYADLGGDTSQNHLEVNGNQYLRELRFADWDETNTATNDALQSAVIHEIAHNWNSELELTRVDPLWSGHWAAFLALSGWTDTDPNDPVNYTVSGDGQWWYLNSAGFADARGQTNPFEDAATVWEFYYSDQVTLDAGLQSKLDFWDLLFDQL